MEGEKHTKYFLNLEKNRSAAKTCNVLIHNDAPVTDPHTILQLQQQYYQDLYTSDPNVEFRLEDNVPVKVDEDSIAAQELQFTVEELQDAVKGMKNNSCPGSDGLPIEFYKMFWNSIKDIYYSALCAIFEDCVFHSTARLGILNLIPKGNKDTRFLQNLRPITLLNVDYKILEKTVANRMTPALCEIIHLDQKGFLPGRRISANIRKIMDTVILADEEELNGLILSCDYMKCFDRVEFTSFKSAMRYFRFFRVAGEVDGHYV